MTDDKGRTQIGNTPVSAEELLEKAAKAQEAYWDALAELEKELGIEIDTEQLGELSAYTVTDLEEKFQ